MPARPAQPAGRRPRVERIIKAAARIDNSKAAGPVASVLRDAMLPIILKMTADSEQFRQVYDYHIDWDAPVTGVHRPRIADVEKSSHMNRVA